MKLQAEGIVKRYGPRTVVRGVSVEVSSGEVVGLLGPNGAGKSTTFHSIVGLIAPDEGRITLDGEDLTSLPMYQRARRGLGYLAQEPSLFRGLTVEENIRAILEFMPLEPSARRKREDHLLEDLGLTSLRRQRVVTLSGGEKRRCEIARSLVTHPQFLLLDEPFVGIDPITVADIQSIVAALKTRGLGILITDHNVRETLEIIDRAYIIYEGKILKEGPAKQLLEDPETRRVYLGEKFRF